MEQKLSGDHARPPGARICHPSKVPSGYIAGVREVWVASYSGVFDDEPTAMVLDGSGNVYVTGYTAVPDYSAYVTIKYNPQGQQEWSASYNPPNNISSSAAIAIDHSGNVYVTGPAKRLDWVILIMLPSSTTTLDNNSGLRGITAGQIPMMTRPLLQLMAQAMCMSQVIAAFRPAALLRLSTTVLDSNNGLHSTTARELQWLSRLIAWAVSM